MDEVVELNKFEVKKQTFTHNSVNYKKLRSSAKLKSLVAQQYKALADAKVPEVLNERLAFFMNAYNFLTLKDLQDHPKVVSMKKLGWKNKRFLLSGIKISLDELEHNLIRPLNDPRIHFAINCASVGCPSLDDKAFKAESVNQKLDTLTENAFKNPLHLKLKGNLVRATRLFSWFKGDFTQNSEDGVAEFIAKYSSLSGDLNIKTDLPYDWQLNNKENIIEVLKNSAKPYDVEFLK